MNDKCYFMDTKRFTIKNTTIGKNEDLRLKEHSRLNKLINILSITTINYRFFNLSMEFMIVHIPMLLMQCCQRNHLKAKFWT